MDKKNDEAKDASAIDQPASATSDLESHPDFHIILQEELDKIEKSVLGEIDLIDEEVDKTQIGWTLSGMASMCSAESILLIDGAIDFPRTVMVFGVPRQTTPLMRGNV